MNQQIASSLFEELQDMAS